MFKIAVLTRSHLFDDLSSIISIQKGQSNKCKTIYDFLLKTIKTDTADKSHNI